MQLYKLYAIVLFILSMSLICLFSCYKVTSQYDNIEGNTKNKMNGNTLAGTPFLSSVTVKFDVQKIQPDKGPESYQIFIKHNFVKMERVEKKGQLGNDYFKAHINNRSTKYPVRKKIENVVSSNLDWLFLEEKESLILFIDGEQLVLKGKHVSVGYQESIRYEVTRQQLEKIATADNVRVRIIGEKDIERHFSKRNFANLKKFLEKY